MPSSGNIDKLTKAEPANDKELRTKLVREDIMLPKDFENMLAFVLHYVFTEEVSVST